MTRKSHIRVRPKQVERELRVAEFCRRELSTVIRNKIRDPRIDGINVSVNDVRVTRDLSYAEVYVSCISTETAESRKELIECLNAAGGFLRSWLAGRNTMRTTPKLRFHYDEVEEQANRLEQLISRATQRDSHGS